MIRKLSLTPAIVRLVGEIDEFKGGWQAVNRIAPERLATLRKVATIESVASSTRIEGVTLTNEEVQDLLSGVEVRSFRSRDEQEVLGYADAMELVFSSWREIGLTENHVKQLHGVLLKHSDRDERHRGEYKKLPNRVEKFDAHGRSLGVVFQTAEPADTPRLMKALVDATRHHLEHHEHHPLLVIAVFTVRLLAIHPFQDGNGRLSRILTTLLLLRAGYAYVPFSSLERVIEENKQGYYKALRSAQSTLDKGEEHLGDWVLYFLRSLTLQKDWLRSRLDRERLLETLPELSERILALARERGRVTMADITKVIGANRNTAKSHLRRLVERGLLTRRGERRGAFYEPSSAS
ncbi:MAG: DUF977 family protein [Acidobacteriota bacterium]